MGKKKKLKRGRKIEILIVRKDVNGVARLVDHTKAVRRFGTFSPPRYR